MKVDLFMMNDQLCALVPHGHAKGSYARHLLVGRLEDAYRNRAGYTKGVLRVELETGLRGEAVICHKMSRPFNDETMSGDRVICAVYDMRDF